MNKAGWTGRGEWIQKRFSSLNRSRICRSARKENKERRRGEGETFSLKIHWNCKTFYGLSHIFTHSVHYLGRPEAIALVVGGCRFRCPLETELHRVAHTQKRVLEAASAGANEKEANEVERTNCAQQQMQRKFQRKDIIKCDKIRKCIRNAKQKSVRLSRSLSFSSTVSLLLFRLDVFRFLLFVWFVHLRRSLVCPCFRCVGARVLMLTLAAAGFVFCISVKFAEKCHWCRLDVDEGVQWAIDSERLGHMHQKKMLLLDSRQLAICYFLWENLLCVETKRQFHSVSLPGRAKTNRQIDTQTTNISRIVRVHREHWFVYFHFQ